jgi:hypothetical protein
LTEARARYRDGMSPATTVVCQHRRSTRLRRMGDCRLPLGMGVRLRRQGAASILEPVVSMPATSSTSWSSAFLASAGSWQGRIPRPGRGEPARDPVA